MIFREPKFYREFHCLGDLCPDTCCRDWEIVVDQDYLDRCGERSEELRQAMLEGTAVDEEGDRCFRLNPRGYCVFLDGKGLCSIQRRWGGEHLSGHCAAYPRFIEEYGCMIERNLAVSCPEAARLTMECGAGSYCEKDDKVDDPPFEGVDGTLLAGLVASRSQARKIMFPSSRCHDCFWAYIRALMEYAAALQYLIDSGRFSDLASCPVPEFRKEYDEEELRARSVRLLEFLSELEPLRPQWPALLKKRAAELAALSPEGYSALTREYSKARIGWAPHLEHLIEALLFHHWPKAVNDGDLYGRAGFAAAACAALYHLGMLAWREEGVLTSFDEALLWSRFSREVEHDEDNFRRVREFLWESSLL